MDLNISGSLKSLETLLQSMFRKDPQIEKNLGNATLTVGLESEPKYQMPLEAFENPIFVGSGSGVGDAGSMLGDIVATEDLKTLMKTDPARVMSKFTFNEGKNKFDIHYKQRGVGDADSGLISGQLYSPWLVSWFEKVFVQPLLYTGAFKLCKNHTGSSPWGDVMSLPVAQFAGFSDLSFAGDLENNANANISIKNGMMSAPIINMDVTYAFSLAEKEAAKGGNFPYANQMMALKPKYADYVLDMMKAYLILYGNAATGTVGILSRNAIVSWASYAGSNTYMKYIAADSSNTAKGSKMYQLLYTAIKDFLTAGQGRYNNIKISLCPETYYILAGTPYSDVYESKSVLETLRENLSAEANKEGRELSVEFVIEPLFTPGSLFNANAYDYMAITAPSIKSVGNGVEDGSQDLIMNGMPIDKFVFPVYPNLTQQFKQFSRVAGLFIPVSSAVKVYSGFGIQ